MMQILESTFEEKEPCSYFSLCTMLCLAVQLCPTLWDSMDCSPPDSSVHGDSPGKNTGVGCQALLQGIFPTQGSNSGLPHCRRILHHLSHQASPWILEWVAYPFSKGFSWPGIELRYSTTQADSSPAELPGEPTSHSTRSQTSQECPHSCLDFLVSHSCFSPSPILWIK